jgi:hypothetical protein
MCAHGNPDCYDRAQPSQVEEDQSSAEFLVKEEWGDLLNQW